MKIKNKNIRHTFFGSVLMLSMVLLPGCHKFLEIPLPTNSVAGDGAFITDNSVSAVVTGIYYAMFNSSTTFSGGESIGFRTALYTDELQNINPANTANQVFYTNTIQNANVAQWTPIYKLIYQDNLALEGIAATTATLNNKGQWVGELLFLRAYLYYCLVNLYGDVPLALKSDFYTNNVLARSPKADAYKQMIADLIAAKGMLPTVYKDGYGLNSTLRVRPNQFAANALLARVYLETGDFVNAEAQASIVISNTAFTLPAPASAFLAASTESIWSLSPTTPGFVKEFSTYNNNMPAVITGTSSPLTYSVNVALTTALAASFEAGDTRFTNWVRSSTTATPVATYYFPNKYKSNVFGGEFLIMLRLAEQYLIRAEARAQQNKITGANSAKTDLDAVRARAGLTGTTAAIQTDMLTAIMKERRVELFTESGFRFFDLKRTGTIDAVMTAFAPSKNATWSPYKQIWPIPTADILVDPNLIQAPGYQ